jgi:glycosyltransferase involved in cell wall biosynthesis
MHFDIVISHYKNIRLLRRTLLSIAEAELPEHMHIIHVVENGMKSGAEKICAEFQNSLPLQYHYHEVASLVAARNRGIKESTADFILMFDNDLKIEANTLVAYDKAFLLFGQEHYYGGPVTADYELPPEAWLTPFFPYSAKGFSLNITENSVKSNQHYFLGANHVISRMAIKKLGRGSNVYLGTGASGDGGGVGEEVRLQQELDTLEFSGVYVSEGLVHHYVPQEVCSVDWIKNRQYRHGIESASTIELIPGKWHLFNIPAWVLKRFLKSFINMLINSLSFDKKRRLRSQLDFWKNIGVIHGMKNKDKNAN